MAKKKSRPLEEIGDPPEPRRGHREPRQPPAVTPPERMRDEPDLEGLQREADEAERRAAEDWQRRFPDNLTAANDAVRLRHVLGELAQRRIESLSLYEPLAEQQRFHASNARIRILPGSNRGGKTLAAAVEVARAVTGNDPFHKYPRENGRFFIVGKDLAHVGEVMWRKLGRAGAFRMIRDEHSQEWRSFRPWEEYDHAYREKAKEAPPLIPPRFIKGRISWESKAEGIPSKITLTTGWEICCYSSLGKPPNGVDLDGWWFDEEIVDDAWFPEMRARLLDRGGRGLWSATPQTGTEVLYDLHERAEKDEHLANPKVAEFRILLKENPHIGDEEKTDLAADLSDEERRVRIGGEWAFTSYKVYPSYSPALHGVDWFEIPQEWTRYMVVDPGHRVCACLFAAVPPPQEGDYIYLYDELYLHECDAISFGDAVAERAKSQTFQSFLIDQHYAIHTDAGVGKNILQQYTESLRRKGVASIATGSSFHLASDDVQAGISAVRGWLSIRADGTPKLRVLKNTLRWFEYEIKRYHFQRIGNSIPTDKPNQRKDNHLMDALRYLAMFNPQYVKRKPGRQRPSGAYAAFLEMQKRANSGSGQHIRFGPGRKYG